MKNPLFRRPAEFGAVRRALTFWLITFVTLGSPWLSAATYFVNVATGDDTRTAATATNPATPWKTLTRALEGTLDDGLPNPELVPGDVINVAAGTYNTASGENYPLFLVDAVQVIGAGAATTILSPPTFSPAFQNFSGLLSGTTRLSGFTLVHEGLSPFGGLVRFDVGNVSMAPRIDNNIFQAGAGFEAIEAGINYNDSFGTGQFTALIENNTFTGFTVAGIMGTQASGGTAGDVYAPTIRNNNFTMNNVGIGHRIGFGEVGNGAGTTTPVITGNSFSGNLNNDIRFDFNLLDQFVRLGPTISNNSLTGTGGPAISFTGDFSSGTYTVDPVISNNTITNSLGNAIDFSLSANGGGDGDKTFSPTITGNIITNAGFSGIEVELSEISLSPAATLTYSPTITNNSITTPGNNGLELSLSFSGSGNLVANYIISGNTITNAGSDGISLSLSGECCRSVFDVAITIANNTIDGSGSDGMSLSFSSLTGNDSGKFDLAVTGNTITNSGSDGISLSAGGYTGSAIPQTILVDGNTITGSGSQGISLSITDQTSLISNDIRITNNILNNNNVGLSVYSDGWFVAGVPANAVLVSCNTITGNATAGIVQSSLSFALPADYGSGDRGSLGRNEIRNNGPAGNGLFDFQNNDDQPVKAEQNFWGTTDPAVIDSHISDNEEAGTGAVDFDPFLFVATSCAPADLSITKTDSPDPVSASSTLTYTLTVTNSGPGTATAVTVTDTLPAGVTFVSASGPGFSCTQAGGVVTCTSASMASSTTATITIVVTTPATATTLTNNASVSSAAPDPVAGNNAASATTTVSGGACPDPITNMFPPNNAMNVPVNGTLRFRTQNASSISVFLGEGNAGCSTLLGTTTGNSIAYSNLKGNAAYRWKVVARNPSCPRPVESPCLWFFTEAASCNNIPVVLLEPLNGATDLNSPITFRWTADPNAAGYQVFIAVNGGTPELFATTTGPDATSISKDVPTGQIDWFVVPILANCIAVASARASFNASNCRPPGSTIASSHPNVYDGTDYLTLWEPVEGAVKYIIFESLPNRCQGPEKPDASCFEGAQQYEVPAPQTQLSLVHDVERPTKFHYLVVAEGCQGKRGTASKITTTVVDTNPFHLTAALGYQKDIRTSFVINETGVGKSTLQTGFTASSDKGFLTVTPSSGTIPPAGTTLTVTANPRGLPVGSTTGTVTVTNSNTGAVIANVPISVSLVTPVTPVAKGTPPPNALIIPAVSHIDGSNSSWQTDTAVVNTSGIKLQYQFAFTPSGEDGTQEGKKTVIDVESGQTVTFKDLVKVLFGQGSLNDGQNGALDIRPLNFEGKLTPEAVKLATIASSRTYNDTPTGSVGQFVRGIAFSEFIGKATEGKSAVLSMQHIAQSATFRTNLGLVEGKGEAATVLVRAYNNAGLKIHESSVDLKPFEHRQLNSFLTTQGIGLEDGRMEVEVTSSTGRITAYASVVDNLSTDPILVPGVNTTKLLSTKYAIPGVADLTTATNNWRTDLRMFNGGSAAVTATLQYFKQNEATAAKTEQLTIAPGEVKAVDNLLQSLFGEVNSGGVVHITTPGPSSLVASARTYDRRANGTFGQLVEAVTPDDAFSATDRALQILQIEESPHFRSNLGIVEVNGNPATVEVSASQPDSKVETKLSLQLRANEFVQFPGILRQLNLGTTYYGRIAVRVVSGNGRISGYGSVIDNLSQDPTFANGQ